MPRILRCIVHLGLLLSTGCASIAEFLPTLSAPPQRTPSVVTAEPSPDSTQTLADTPTAVPTNGPRILRVWLPPQFDPNAENDAAKILKKRFDDFEAEHRGVKIEVRIKADEGELGMIDSLTVTNSAAPTVLPDLVALSSS